MVGRRVDRVDDRRASQVGLDDEEGAVEARARRARSRCRSRRRRAPRRGCRGPTVSVTPVPSRQPVAVERPRHAAAEVRVADVGAGVDHRDLDPDALARSQAAGNALRARRCH